MLIPDITIEDTLSADWANACDEMDADLHVASYQAAQDGVEAIQAKHPYTDRTYELTSTAAPEYVAGTQDAEMVFPATNEQGVGYASFVNEANEANGHSKDYEFISRGEKAAQRTLEQETGRALRTAARKVGTFSAP